MAASRFNKWAFAGNAIFGPQREIKDNVRGIEREEAERPNKGPIPTFFAWLGIFTLALIAGSAFSWPIFGELALLLVFYRVAVRAVMQNHERHTFRGIVRAFRNAAPRRSLGWWAWLAFWAALAIRILGLLFAWVDSFGQPSAYAAMGMQVSSPLLWLNQLAYFLAAFPLLGSGLTLFVLAYRVGKKYARGRHFERQTRRQVQEVVQAAIGIRPDDLDRLNLIGYFDNLITVDVPVQYRERARRSLVEDALLRYNATNLMVAPESRQSRIVFQAADAGHAKRLANYEASDGMIIESLGEVTADEVLKGNWNDEEESYE
ncbi:hypothetical protein [Leifsonia xyli]|uniref:hypothetical protein n=1 Tax=Leifsonia xyli TaxID=1575 RepID=UPI003D6686C2